MIRILLFLLTLGISTPAFAQQTNSSFTVKGIVWDTEANTPLPGVNVAMSAIIDSTRQFGQISDAEGQFQIRLTRRGAYRIRFSFVGYKPQEQRVIVLNPEHDLGKIELEPTRLLMDQLVVEAVQERVVIKGDTTEFNADAYKVNPDANAEDLIAKMPGVVVEDGSVQAQGEEVSRVLVDGQEFFGNDPTAALRNMPAEVIDKIQVFDRLSDQAQFTGFDDGNNEKTINIITRPGMNNGQFGKVFGGYGSETRYNAGGNLNIFNGDQRISIIGLSNNINQQNFATEDLLGVVGNTRQRGGGGFGGARGGGGRQGGGGRPPGGGGRGGQGLQSNPSNFLVGNQGGINQTNAIGLNFSDTWGENLRITSSYFFNASDNQSDVILDREYFLTDLETQLYGETNNSQSNNFNHRFTSRLQYTIDASNSIIFTPNISFQQNDASSNLFGLNALNSGTLLSSTTNDYISNTKGYTSSANLLYRHQFPKQGRTVSAGINLGLNDRSGDSELYAANDFFDAVDSLLIIDQRTRNAEQGITWSSNLAYTEPIGEGQVMLNYSPSISNSDADQTTNAFDAATNTYTLLDPVLSNVFDSQTIRQRAGVNYMRRNQNGMLSFGFDLQDVQLTGDQTFPTTFSVSRSFQSILPRAMLQFRLSQTDNFRLFYRTSTNTPSISQLQSVINNTNPLQLTSGNPDLKQSYSQSLVARFNKTNPQSGRVFMGFASISQSNDHIASESIIALQDTTLAPGVLLAQGSQFSRPINQDGYWNARSFFTLGTPSELLKSNINMNAGYSFSRTPGLINDEKNIADVHSLSGGLVLGSNISQYVDFSLSYALGLNSSTNTAYPELDANYLSHRGGAKINLLLGQSWVFDTNINILQYSGLGDSFDQNNLVWNAGLGYKFLKGNGGEVKLLMADILNQNNSITRTINEFYVEDNSSNVLGRYVLLNFTYKLRHFRM